jgi:hypothetical protein
MVLPQPDGEPYPNARRQIEAARARREAAAARARAAVRLAMEAAHRRRDEAMRAYLARMDEIHRRRNDPSFGSGGAERRGGFRRGEGEEGEPVPVVPKPRPNPLLGAAAAPIE